jgi:hypothetical protein
MRKRTVGQSKGREKKGQLEANKTEKDNESKSENNSDDDMLCLVTDLVLSTTEISNWQYDDGASIHTTNKFEKLVNPIKKKVFIRGHDNSGSYCTHITVKIVGHGNTVAPLDIHYASQFLNLISGQRLPYEGNEHYRGTNARLETNGKIIFKIHHENGKHFVKEEATN